MNLDDLLDSPMGDGPPRKRSMTLVEVVVAIFLAALVAGGLMASIFMATQSTAIAAQQTAAMQLCMELIEDMRVRDFADLTDENFPPETNLVLTLSRNADAPLIARREATISNADSTDIDARRVQILVSWAYRGMEWSVPYETIIYKFH